MVVEPVASVTAEGKPCAATITEALRTDERLSEPASGDLAGTGASSVTSRDSVTEPVKVITVIEEAPRTLPRRYQVWGHDYRDFNSFR